MPSCAKLHTSKNKYVEQMKIEEKKDKFIIEKYRNIWF